MRSIHPASLALLFGACASAPLELRAPNPELAVTVAPGEFPGAGRLATGFDARTTDRAWRAGDTVVFGLRLQQGESAQRWLLRLRVLPSPRFTVETKNGTTTDGVKFLGLHRSWNYTAKVDGELREVEVESGIVRVAVSVHDPDGSPLGDSIVSLPADLMTNGLLPGIETAMRLEASTTGNDPLPPRTSLEDLRPMAEGLIALLALLDVVQNDSVLQGYFWQVVQKPSLWSVIRTMGVSASLTASPERSVRLEQLPEAILPTDRAFAMPLRVDVNDTPALLADVIAIDSARPYALCSGIIAASARHPTEKDLTFEVRLLAARLGKE